MGVVRASGRRAVEGARQHGQTFLSFFLLSPFFSSFFAFFSSFATSARASSSSAGSGLKAYASSGSSVPASLVLSLPPSLPLADRAAAPGTLAPALARQHLHTTTVVSSPELLPFSTMVSSELLPSPASASALASSASSVARASASAFWVWGREQGAAGWGWVWCARLGGERLRERVSMGRPS